MDAATTVITFVAPRAGVGVTTTLRGIAAALRADSRSVLCVDMSDIVTVPQPTPGYVHVVGRAGLVAAIESTNNIDFVLIDTSPESAKDALKLGHPVVIVVTPGVDEIAALEEHARLHVRSASPLVGVALVRTTDQETSQATSEIRTQLERHYRNACSVFRSTISDHGPEARRFRRDDFTDIEGPLGKEWFSLADELTDQTALLRYELGQDHNKKAPWAGSVVGVDNLTPNPDAQQELTVPSQNKARRTFLLPTNVVEAMSSLPGSAGDLIVHAVTKHRRAILIGSITHTTVKDKARVRGYFTSDESERLDNLAETLEWPASHVVAAAMTREHLRGN